MDTLEYVTSEKISLKNHPNFNEAWLQGQIANDPQLLGLGELVVLDRERRQANGRLDLLLGDSDNETRFEVELMLGKTDESHIIRTIEYWDIERRRYPLYDHCAVLIAENVTSRFLNVLSLFNGHIPIIIIQLDALKIDDTITLNFVKIMDRFELRKDDEIEINRTPTDRNYWENRTTENTLSITDDLLKIINSTVQISQQLNYNKYHIGLFDGIKSRNFIYFRPKKAFTHMLLEIDDKENWIEKLEETEISVTKHKNYLQMTISSKLLRDYKEIIAEIINASVKKYNEQ